MRVQKQKNKKGITLVALIITIVILLILSGVAISTLSNTGIFQKAKEAKQKSENMEKIEEKTLSEYEKELNKNSSSELTMENANIVLSQTKNTELHDVNGNKIVVPAGFKIVVNDETNNALTVDKGIVIEDTTSNATVGSQFVWIPVGIITKKDGTTVKIKLNRYTFDENGIPTEQNENEIGSVFSETASEGNIVAKNIGDFKKSVEKNGGYYIGRYEARKKGEQITEVATDNVMNKITQPNAAKKAQNMYDVPYFTSDLTNSYAWDTAILFLQNCGTDLKYSRKGRVSNVLSLTGTNTQEIKDLQCNVYDMSSNLLEFTTETSNYAGYACVYRGGGYSFEGKDRYTSSRSNFPNSIGYADDGFRSILYINI